jgi:hypothetical protein
VVYGGKSTKTRSAQMIKLADVGFNELKNWLFLYLYDNTLNTVLKTTI